MKNPVEKLIKQQGDIVCQERIGTDYIKERLKDYTFGFARSSQRAMIGLRQTRQTPERNLNGFVLCKKIENDFFTEVDVTLVCSRKNAKDGKELIHLVEEKAKEMGCHRLILFAIGNARLLRWYESLGFVVQSYKTDPDNGNKSYMMIKKL